MVEVRLGLALEEEALLRERLELDQAAGARADERARDRVRELDAERLRTRACGKSAQPPLDVDRRRSLG